MQRSHENERGSDDEQDDEHEQDEVAPLTLDEARAMIEDLEKKWTALCDPSMNREAREICKVTTRQQSLCDAEENNKILPKVFASEFARVNAQYDALVARPRFKSVATLLEDCTKIEQRLEDALTDAEEAAEEAHERRDLQAAAFERNAEALKLLYKRARRLNNDGHTWLLRHKPSVRPRAEAAPTRMPLPLVEAGVPRSDKEHPGVRVALETSAQERVARFKARRRQKLESTSLRRAQSAEDAERALGKAPLGTLSLRQGLRYFGRAY